jgi:hypothetical protein
VLDKTQSQQNYGNKIIYNVILQYKNNYKQRPGSGNDLIISSMVKVKVNQFLYMSGQALRALGVTGSQNF